jgi:hypothetical protein
MYEELYQYLIHHRELPVPGVGTFRLERKPAVSDFPARMMMPPVYSVAFQLPSPTPSRIFYSWLGAALHISDRDALRRFNDFAFDLKQQLNEGTSVHWQGVGRLSKGLAGEVKFVADAIDLEKPVPAEKVIREKAEHMVRVGEQEKTAEEMTVLLTKPAVKRDLWWVYAAAVALLAVMFIGWYLSEKGVGVNSVANTKKVELHP